MIAAVGLVASVCQLAIDEKDFGPPQRGGRLNNLGRRSSGRRIEQHAGFIEVRECKSPNMLTMPTSRLFDPVLASVLFVIVPPEQLPSCAEEMRAGTDRREVGSAPSAFGPRADAW